MGWGGAGGVRWVLGACVRCGGSPLGVSLGPMFSVFFVGLHSFFKAEFLFYIIEGSD